jgi:hypothetical protein
MLNKLSFLFLFSFLVLTVACGDDGGSPPVELPLTTMTGQVEITGDKMVAGGFSRLSLSNQPTCAAYAAEGLGANDAAAGAEGSFVIPGPVISVPLKPSGDVYGSTLHIIANVYQGPGTYVNTETVTQLQGQIVLDEIPDGPNYYLADGTSRATINADGSGSVTFDDIPEDNVENPTFISGTITWTCTDEEEATP